jgi:hypothetical protein
MSKRLSFRFVMEYIDHEPFHPMAGQPYSPMVFYKGFFRKNPIPNTLATTFPKNH